MNGKTVLITGASGGIGLELARLFAAQGYDLIVTARREAALRQLADEAASLHGARVHVIAMDLAQPFAGSALWQSINGIATDIDVLVNNAGCGDAGDFCSEPPGRIERMIHLNIAALTSLTRAVLPGMLDRRRGHILNVASLAGFQPGGPGMSVYYATKSYVLSFSRGIRMELGGTGVNVTALCPGPTRTEFEHNAAAGNTRLFHMPAWPPMDARAVAAAGYRGMLRGRAVVVPGRFNSLLAAGVRWIPASVALRINRMLLSQRG